MDWRVLNNPILLVVTVLTLLGTFVGLSCTSSTGRSKTTNSIPNNAELSAESEALDQASSRLLRCLPTPSATLPAAQTEPISIVRIERLANRTRIELVAWAGPEPFDLQLPLYLTSRGRWLRGNDERVFIVDQECRQYSLYDVEFLQPRLTAGIIRIPAREAITGAFIFPPLGLRARFGALVIGDRFLPALFPAPPSAPAQPDGRSGG